MRIAEYFVYFIARRPIRRKKPVWLVACLYMYIYENNQTQELRRYFYMFIS